jgi:hypothetical protein
MTEVMSGLVMQADEGVVAGHMLQISSLAQFLKQRYGMPILSGCHAI